LQINLVAPSVALKIVVVKVGTPFIKNSLALDLEVKRVISIQLAVIVVINREHTERPVETAPR
jgi:hypothetical protein